MWRDDPRAGAGRAEPGLPGEARPAPERAEVRPATSRRYGPDERHERTDDARLLRRAPREHGDAVRVAAQAREARGGWLCPASAERSGNR
jgi:hypothetical protein